MAPSNSCRVFISGLRKSSEGKLYSNIVFWFPTRGAGGTRTFLTKNHIDVSTILKLGHCYSSTTSPNNPAPSSNPSHASSSPHLSPPSPKNSSKQFSFGRYGLAALCLAFAGLYGANYYKQHSQTRIPFTNTELKHMGIKRDRIPPVLLSPQQVTQMLRKNQSMVELQALVVQSVHKASVPSNSPMEDRQAEILPESVLDVEKEKLPMNKPTFIFAIFDGHAGWQCSEYLSKSLPTTILEEIQGWKNKPKTFWESIKGRSEVSTILALKSAFQKEDEKVVKTAIRLVRNGQTVPKDVVERMYAGSCAIVAYLEGDELSVANTGDCRGILGVRNPDGTLKALPLSVDQTFENPNEVAKMLKEHPNEDVIRKKRVFGGLQPSRAFGDSLYKLTPYEVDEIDAPVKEHLGENLYNRRARRIPPELLKSAPYVTAEPEVVKRVLQPGDEFLVLATDGLWDRLNSQEVVDLVGMYLDHHGKQQASDSDFIPMKEKGLTTKVLSDTNVATHLIRNSLGGDTPTTSLLLSLTSPHSRRARDDISVTVVFFNQEALAECKNSKSE